jgi:transposase InsO family protein
MDPLYFKLKEKARGCRDREIRVKLELILLALKLGDVSEACARRGYSRKFFYKWFGRLEKAKWNLQALREMSRRPQNTPKRISQKLEKRIRFFASRQYGMRMIEALMAREKTPVSRSTIGHVLRKRRKSTRKKKKTFNPHIKRYELVIPGQRFQIDVKYVPEFVEGKRAYAYVAVDECTRWRFAWAYFELNQYSTEDFLTRLKVACPFPIYKIQTDQGFEFSFKRSTDHNVNNEHRLTQWCRENDVLHRLLPPGAKELNGKVERSHRIDEQYFYWKAPTDNLEHFNAELGAWLEFYHRQRPHGGLEYRTPWEKLCERLVALRNEPLPAELEPIRLKFLEQSPKKMTNVRPLLLTKNVRKRAA